VVYSSTALVSTNGIRIQEFLMAFR